VVSTDSETYKKIAESYGASVILRPQKISEDHSKSEEEILYVLEILENQGKSFDNIVFIQTTNPLVNSADIDSGIEKIEKENSSSVVAYTDFNGLLTSDEDFFEKKNLQEKKLKRLKTSALWIAKIKEIKLSKNRICKPVSYLKLNWLTSIEIDNEQKLQIIESIMEKENRIKTKGYYKKRPYTGDYGSYYVSNRDPDGIIRHLTTEKEMKHRAESVKDEIKYINEQIKDGKPRKILDLGCGTGVISTYFDKNYIKYGLEIEDSISDPTRKTFDKDKLHVGVLGNNIYSEEFFDIVFTSQVIEHVPEPIKFIKNVWRILKTHGKLVIGTPNFDSAAARRFGDNFRLLYDKTHCSLFGDRGLCHLLDDHGFRIDKIDYPFFDTKYFTIGNLERLFDTTKVSPPFYGNMMTVYAIKK
jgi:CMP-N-acetylneuraminic acid synthetase/SAM-dependent methyltransferase